MVGKDLVEKHFIYADGSDSSSQEQDGSSQQQDGSFQEQEHRRGKKKGRTGGGGVAMVTEVR